MENIIKQLFSKITDAELKEAINEIELSESTGIIAENGYVREYAKLTGEITGGFTTTDFMMVTINLCKEAAYRWSKKVKSNDEILDITKKLYHNHLTPETATSLLSMSNDNLIHSTKLNVNRNWSIPDGKYNGLYSGYSIKITTLGGKEFHIETKQGIKGIDRPIKIEAINGNIYRIEKTGLDEIIQKHTEKLNIMKTNLSEMIESGKYTDEEFNLCQQQITALATIISDLNHSNK